jgi:TRAP transporter 4TM/12TM fusion protein
MPLISLPARIVTSIALLLVGFQLYTAAYAPLSAIFQRSAHLSLVLTLVFFIYPVHARAHPALRWTIDSVLIALGLTAGGYLFFNYDAIVDRMGWYETWDIGFGVVMVLLLLEATRRTLGWVMTGLALFFLTYVFAGPWLPGVLAHKGYSLERVAAQMYLTTEGIFGVPLGVAATYVFIFILFGALLEATGAGRFFIDMAYAIAGRRRGGPAKAAVVASGFMASFSGSAIANAATTGAFTIPLMKKLGYKPAEAAGVEAAASTGGQIMPPIMGAGAFLMAEYTGVPYLDIVKMAIVPALLYFFAVYLFVDAIAAKRGMTSQRREDLPRISRVLRQGGHFLLPLGVLIYYLIQGVSPTRVGFIAVLAVFIVSFFRASSRISPGAWLNALERAARAALPVSIACATAGIVVGAVGLTGIGLKFSDMVISLSGGFILPALILVALASLVLGMGLPVTAAYIVLVVLAGPALQDLGIALITAHMVVFWLSQDSNVTPPVALAAYAAAGIAQAAPMQAGLQAWKFAKGLYVIPLLMVYAPGIMLQGDWGSMAFDILIALAAIIALVSALEGYRHAPLRVWERLALLAAAALLFPPSAMLRIVALALIVLLLGIHQLRARRARINA